MKLQPTFSWQKYEGDPEDSQEQFQYQLQQQHILVANAVNSTIDDESFFTRERQTSFTWIDGRPIFTKSIATSAWTVGGTVNTIPLGITGGKTGGFTIIAMNCCISNGTASSSNTLNLPHIDVAVAANEISIVRNGTNVILTSGGTSYAAYSGFLTVYYVKS